MVKKITCTPPIPPPPPPPLLPQNDGPSSIRNPPSTITNRLRPGEELTHALNTAHNTASVRALSPDCIRLLSSSELGQDLLQELLQRELEDELASELAAGQFDVEGQFDEEVHGASNGRTGARGDNALGDNAPSSCSCSYCCPHTPPSVNSSTSTPVNNHECECGDHVAMAHANNKIDLRSIIHATGRLIIKENIQRQLEEARRADEMNNIRVGNTQGNTLGHLNTEGEADNAGFSWSEARRAHEMKSGVGDDRFMDARLNLPPVIEAKAIEELMKMAQRWQDKLQLNTDSSSKVTGADGCKDPKSINHEPGGTTATAECSNDGRKTTATAAPSTAHNEGTNDISSNRNDNKNDDNKDKNKNSNDNDINKNSAKSVSKNRKDKNTNSSTLMTTSRKTTTTTSSTTTGAVVYHQVPPREVTHLSSSSSLAASQQQQQEQQQEQQQQQEHQQKPAKEKLTKLHSTKERREKRDQEVDERRDVEEEKEKQEMDDQRQERREKKRSSRTQKKEKNEDEERQKEEGRREEKEKREGRTTEGKTRRENDRSGGLDDKGRREMDDQRQERQEGREKKRSSRKEKKEKNQDQERREEE